MSTNPGGAHRARPTANADTTTTTTSPQTTTPQATTPQVTAPPSGAARDGHANRDPEIAPAGGPGRAEVLDRQRERFGGIKWGSAFFGWLTATGTALILTAIAAAAGAAFGVAAFGLATTPGGVRQAAGQATQAAQNPGIAQTAGITGAIVVLVILLIAYYCGGYVAGRMARFNGVRQGVAVWLWAIIIAIIVAILVAIVGTQFTVLQSIGGLPQLPISGNALTIGGIIAALAALAASLIGAILGGLAGMRYHRTIDRVEFER